MVPLSVYVETSVWSCAFATDVPQYTRDTIAFFDSCRNKIVLANISVLVIDEIDGADPEKKRKLLGLIQDIEPAIVQETDESLELADAFVREGVVPAGKSVDARHVAIAFVSGLDVLVSWNFRHIASVRRSERFNVVAMSKGYYKHLRIDAPPELIYDDENEIG